MEGLKGIKRAVDGLAQGDLGKGGLSNPPESKMCTRRTLPGVAPCSVKYLIAWSVLKPVVSP